MKLRVSSVLGLLVFLTVSDTLVAKGPPKAERVEAIAAMLPATARGVGRPIDDRAAWDALAATPAAKKIIKQAEGWLGKPMPELTDDLYLEFSRNGNRSRCQSVLKKRHGRLEPLVVAECLENRGRFLAEIEKTILAMCGEKTWVLPAHDRGLTNFKGTQVTIDLRSSHVGWTLATVDCWLGDRLSPAVRRRIHEELERRVFNPYERMVNEGKPRMWWLHTTNNWNAVCLANVTGAALACVESPQRRAFYVASAEKYIKYFLKGFTDDGYCSEGVGYWNYGFGHYVMLAETLVQATGGRIDLMDAPNVRQIAQFGRRLEINPGVYPSFADCKPGTKPASWIEGYVSRRFGFGWRQGKPPTLPLGTGRDLAGVGLWSFPNSLSALGVAQVKPASRPPHDWFDKAQVLICRPSTQTERPFGVALKAGHNAEHHNHNDVGSFVVALGPHTPLVDPGGEVYTSRTFSRRRYESGVLSSWGHSVPRVAGKLQRTGRKAAAEVLSVDSRGETDTLTLELRAAYDVETLVEMGRTFVYSRRGRGSLKVIDQAIFASPELFGTTLVTFDTWKRTGPRSLRIGTGDAAVDVEIASPQHRFEINAEKIKEDLPGRRVATRLSIDLTDLVEEAAIVLIIRPAA